MSSGVIGGRLLGLTTLPPSFADSLEILGASISWGPKVLSTPVPLPSTGFAYPLLPN